jgi:hypothetical protein
VPRLSGTGRNRVHRRIRGDRGAAATIVSVLLAGGVLLGMTALVVDVGQLYAEREELMSGADSAAFAVAVDCALNRDDCVADEFTGEGPAHDKATDYAARNARDGLADATVCGADPRLPDCVDPPAGNLTDCLGDRPTDGPAYVEVRTTTRVSENSTLLPPSFAQTLVSGYQGTTVGACSRVAYGPPAGGLAITFSFCEWYNATVDEHGEHTNYPPPGATELELAEYEVALYTHDSQQSADCWEGPPHFDGPGGFGWLDDEPTKDCLVEIDEGGTYESDQGNNVTSQCQDAVIEAFESGTPIPIPIFKEVTGSGQLEYTLDRVEAFVITGFRISGNPSLNEPSYLTDEECVGQERCLLGYFTNAVVDWAGPIGTGPISGAVVVKTIG